MEQNYTYDCTRAHHGTICCLGLNCAFSFAINGCELFVKFDFSHLLCTCRPNTKQLAAGLLLVISHPLTHQLRLLLLLVRAGNRA